MLKKYRKRPEILRFQVFLVRVLRFELKAVPPLCGVTAYRPFYVNARGLAFSIRGTKKKCFPFGNTSFGPSVEIRTQGLLNPIQARYQTSPHPDMYFAVRQLCYITTPFPNLQALISNFSKNFFVAAALSLTTVGGYGILYPAFGIETGRFHTRRDG